MLTLIIYLVGAFITWDFTWVCTLDAWDKSERLLLAVVVVACLAADYIIIKYKLDSRSLKEQGE